MKRTMDTYALGGQLHSRGEYDRTADIYASMGHFSDAPERANAARYAAADAAMIQGTYVDDAQRFTALGEYSDSAERAQESSYLSARALHDAGDYLTALRKFLSAGLSSYSDSNVIMNDCRYQLGQAAAAQGDYEQSFTQYGLAGEADRQQEMAYQTGMAKLTAADYAVALDWFWQSGPYSDT